MRFVLSFFILLFAFNAQSKEHKELHVSKTDMAKYVTIRHIDFIGNKKTKRSILLRELSLAENQTISSDSINFYTNQTQLRLATLGIFTEINIKIDTISNDQIDMLINVKERWFIIPEPAFQLADRNFNVWWTEQNRDLRRTIIGITLRDKNFRGNLENLSVTGQVGYTQIFSINYFNPYLDKSKKKGFGASVGFAESQETFYATDSNKLKFIKTKDRYIMRQYSADVSYAYRPAYASRHILRLAYKYFQIEDTIVKLNPNYFKNGSKFLKYLELSYRYELNKTDNINYPLTGTKMVGQVFVRMGLEGMDQQIFGTLELGKYYRLGNKWYISSTFRGRLTTPELQPYTFQNALGTKYDYVRGYEYYVIDGAQYGVLRFNFKRELLNFTIKRIPIKYLPSIPIRIYPKIFADAGYVSNQYYGDSFLNNRLLYAAGFGVDIYTAYDLKVRFEYAWNHLGQKGLFLHFNSE